MRGLLLLFAILLTGAVFVLAWLIKGDPGSPGRAPKAEPVASASPTSSSEPADPVQAPRLEPGAIEAPGRIEIAAMGEQGAQKSEPFGPLIPRLSGRLVDEQGAALARRAVRVKFIEGDGAPAELAARSQWRFWTSTDENGEFQFALNPVPPPRAGQIELGVLAERRSPSAVARTALPENVSVGVIALGDIVARAVPILCSGLVIDETGAPIAGAGITIDRELGTGSSSNAWHRDAELRTKTDASGRFWMHGAGDLGALRVSASRFGFGPPVTVSAQPGDREIRLVLEHPGEIAGRIELDPGLAPELFSVRVRSTLANGAQTDRSAAVFQDATFRVDSIRPGVAEVAVLVGRDPEPIAEVAGVLVAANTFVRDPRLDPLDLRGRVKLLRIDVLDHYGRPVRRGSVVASATEPKPGLVGFDLSDGRALVPFRGHSVDLWIRAPGYREQRLASVDGDRTVELKPAIVVRLRLGPGVHLPEPPTRLAVALVPASATGKAGADRGADRQSRRVRGSGAQASTYFGPEGEARIELSAPGSFAVRFDLRVGNARRPPIEAVPAAIEVADRETEQVFVVAPDAARYEQSLGGPR